MKLLLHRFLNKYWSNWHLHEPYHKDQTDNTQHKRIELLKLFYWLWWISFYVPTCFYSWIKFVKCGVKTECLMHNDSGSSLLYLTWAESSCIHFYTTMFTNLCLCCFWPSRGAVRNRPPGFAGVGWRSAESTTASAEQSKNRMWGEGNFSGLKGIKQDLNKEEIGRVKKSCSVWCIWTANMFGPFGFH